VLTAPKNRTTPTANPLHEREPNIDQARRRPHLRGQTIVYIPILEPVEVQPITAGASSFDPQMLRGIPAIGRNVTGAIHGTNPEGAIR
jgi:hypothetical protein